MKIALVASKVTPYRVPVFEKLAQSPEVDLHVVFCAEREPNRQWDLPPLNFEHSVLREHFTARDSRYIHNNVDVIPALRRLRPDVVVTCGFNPTQLYAFGYSQWKRLAHVPFTDGTFASEQSLSRLHRAVRRLVFRRSQAFVSASMGGQRLYESYGIPVRRCFRSCLAVDNASFSPLRHEAGKRFDFIFSGRLEPVKNPVFALQVAYGVAKRLGRRTSILFAGSGAEEEAVRKAASGCADLVDAHFHGFALQKELPALYREARIFLFPSAWDPWGLVVNEACAAGLPVLTSPHAGVAGELVRHGENGFVCDLEIEHWVEHAAGLLSSANAWDNASRRSLALVDAYTHDNAAAGLLAACHFAVAARDRNEVKQSAGQTRQANPRS